MYELVDEKVFRNFVSSRSQPRKAYLDKIHQISKSLDSASCSKKNMDIYMSYGKRAKDSYGAKGQYLNIAPTQAFYEAQSVDKLTAKDWVIEKAEFKYKKEEKWDELKSLLKICWALITDADGKKITNDETINSGYCYFTNKSRLLLEKRYGFKMNDMTFRRLIGSAEKVGFLVPNTYFDKVSQTIKKNYRHDMHCPQNSYATSYLVNIKAIRNILKDEIKAEQKELKKNREFYNYINILKADSFDYDFDEVDEKSEKMFAGLFNTKTSMLLTKNGPMQIIDISKPRNKELKNVFYNVLKYLKSKGIEKQDDILSSKEYQEIVSQVVMIDPQDRDSFNSASYGCLKKLFSWVSYGTTDIIIDQLLPEYNNDKDDMTYKYFNLNVSKNSISARAYSPYCATSKKDGSRQEFIDKNNLVFIKDVTAMIPNLSRFLKGGEDFYIEDVYTALCNKIKEEYGITISRNEMKSLFLRVKFTKSAASLVSNMKQELARKYRNDDTDTLYFPYIKSFYKNGKPVIYLDKNWNNTDEGKKQIKLYNSLFKVINDYCGYSTSQIFIWESLLETIVDIDLKRQGIHCYNVYDEFMADKDFDFDSELKKAAKITLAAYNGDTKLLKDFANGII